MKDRREIFRQRPQRQDLHRQFKAPQRLEIFPVGHDHVNVCRLHAVQHFLLRISRAERQQNGPQLPHGAKAQKRSRLVIRPDADMGPSSHALRPQSVRCALAVFIQFPIGTAKTLTDQCRSPGKPPCGLPQHLTDGHVIFSHLSSPDTPIAAAIFLCRRLSGFNVSFPNCALTSQPSQP